MRRQAGSGILKSSRGFTLIELLLVLVLILLLMGAAVFSFSSVQRSARLDEGSGQLDSLLLFLKAHASYTGCRVELRFSDSSVSGTSSGDRSIQALWEPDPLAGPGVLIPLAEAQPYILALMDNIHIEHLNEPEPSLDEEALFVGSADTSSQRLVDTDDHMAPVVPMSFYPDGSSDSVDLRLTSTEAEDVRQLAVRWEGLTGTLRKRWIASEEALLQPSTPFQP
jgi:prepilin-type N-terminal cleavage/methylation domain-containing protein